MVETVLEDLKLALPTDVDELWEGIGRGLYTDPGAFERYLTLSLARIEKLRKQGTLTTGDATMFIRLHQAELHEPNTIARAKGRMKFCITEAELLMEKSRQTTDPEAPFYPEAAGNWLRLAVNILDPVTS